MPSYHKKKRNLDTKKLGGNPMEDLVGGPIGIKPGYASPRQSTVLSPPNYKREEIRWATDQFMHDLDAAYTNHYQEPWQNFDRFSSFNMELDNISTARQYIFMVRPECNILNESNHLMLSKSVELDPFFIYMHKYHRVILKGLTMEFSADHDFIPFLVGRTEMLQIPDYAIKTYSYNQPYTHFVIPYGGNSIESQSGGSFDITFRDDSQFRLHKFFQAWLYYIDGVSRNKFYPKEKFVTYNKIDYATSIYQFIVAPDGCSILWWAKYTGCIPTSVPNSDLSWNKGGRYDGRFSIPFNFFHFESLNPQIIGDFNRNSASRYSEMYSYDPELMSVGPSYVGAPFVSAEDGGFNFVLKWRKPITKYE